MYPGRQQIGERFVHKSLPGHAAEASERRAFDRYREMRFAGAVIAHMPRMLRTVVRHEQVRRGERGGEAGCDDISERSGGEVDHRAYIDGFRI